MCWSLIPLPPFILYSPSPPPPVLPLKELCTTLDGRHWVLDGLKCTTCRSHPPGSRPPPSGTEHSHAPLKPRPSLHFEPPLVPSRVLFLDTSPSLHSGSSPTSSPSDSYVNTDLCLDPSDSDGSDHTIILQSGPLSRAATSQSSDRSFLDDFVPYSFTGSELLAGFSAVLQSTASALYTAASAV